MTNFKQSLHERIDRRMKQLEKVADRLHRMVDQDKLGGEEGRIWLDQYAVGRGFQIAGGDFLVGEATNIDPMTKYMGPDILAYWDEVPFGEEVDYFVTNYFECFPSPLRTLTEWYSQLRSGGVVAMVLRDPRFYDEPAGPMANKNRVNCFTSDTIRCYLVRAGFIIQYLAIINEEIRVVGKKP